MEAMPSPTADGPKRSRRRRPRESRVPWHLASTLSEVTSASDPVAGRLPTVEGRPGDTPETEITTAIAIAMRRSLVESELRMLASYTVRFIEAAMFSIRTALSTWGDR